MLYTAQFMLFTVHTYWFYIGLAHGFKQAMEQAGWGK